ncbi:nucleotidyl transferase AbiEii/AbiGii toxin family protein [Nocardia alba]|uniref:Nucleotidyltransferase AbiEii toxin of type IV toxin-antitoxin system n=1 Tax=Nocardia alba TaxID=225051 RepID=A0A4R1FAV1_9NOCA|nr:nucleotidyl transferase AbiEii/AbiGii toxin family protein [Nocardia alba]TCJ89914.1 nucleotidyltransferase AbiEii toxin of type IV toxin-antitoxin system [Nocardia alba]
MTEPRSISFNRISLNAKIKNVARAMRLPAKAVRIDFFRQRFLARIFDDPTAPWIVTGGGGLLARLPGARASADLDLIRLDLEITDAIDELRRLGVARPDIDPFHFQVDLSKQLTGDAAAGAELRVSVYHGATVLEKFPLDLAVDKTIIGAIETLTPTAVLDLAGFSALPPVRLIPVPSQLADKICAMFARYGDTRIPSTRWRDLADICFIVGNFTFDAALVCAALDFQKQRRDLELPAVLQSPGPEWTRAYPALAKDTALPAELHGLDAALAFSGTCLNQILDGTRTTGHWDPDAHSWIEV